VPTDAALLGAFSLLQSLGNAQNTAAILGQMAEHKKAIDEATAAHDAVAAKAAEVAARESAVATKEQDLASREAALTASQTQLQVASAAIADRDAAVKAKEAASDKRQVEIRRARRRSMTDWPPTATLA
jgi:hypothetical protein